ncbi:MAG TPA: hypothetical protein VJ830_01630 [Anaerolineales bacterium]|nr:hypothetical protein [Anaerolineales bacterium]
MKEKKPLDPARMEVVIAVLIALVSLTTALAAWRTNIVGSAAAEANRQGLLDALKKGAAQNESWNKLYEEAGYTATFAMESAAADAMEASKEESLQAAARNVRQYLLPSLQLLSEPLGTQKKYLKSDGTYDFEKRLADLEAEDPDLFALDPAASFELADRYAAEQRWLTIGTVLLAISLFLLGLAEVLPGRGRAANLTLGLGVYLIGLLFILVIEITAIWGRGGVL